MTPSETRLNDFIQSYSEAWCKETDIFCSFLETKKQENEKIASLEKQIEAAQPHIQSLAQRIPGLLSVDRNIIQSKLEEVYYTLKTRQAFYETYLKCKLSYEQPDVYTFSFFNDSVITGSIQFKHDETRSRWTVLEIHPPNAVPDTMIDEFHNTQDTQAFLCNFRSRI